MKVEHRMDDTLFRVREVRFSLYTGLSHTLDWPVYRSWMQRGGYLLAGRLRSVERKKP